jgi:DNA invertase Pin-like site-specific DNA recombinase
MLVSRHQSIGQCVIYQLTVSFRENLDTGGPLGRAVVIIIGAIGELERNLIIERVRASMRRARLEGRHIGRKPLKIDRAPVLRERDKARASA